MSKWIARIGRVRLRPHDIAAALTLLGGVVIAFALASGLHEADSERARGEFLQRAETNYAAVANSFGDVLVVLQASNSLFEAIGKVDRAQFGAFVLPLMQSHPYLDAVVFHRLVEGAGRGGYEVEQGRARPGFRIQARTPDGVAPAPQRDRYLVAEYVEPMNGNAGLLGFDALSFAPEARAFEQAVESGRPAASRLLPLLQQAVQAQPQAQRQALGVVMVMPVYRGGVVPLDAAARRAAVLGDTAVVLDVGELVGHTLAGARLLGRAGIAIELSGLGEQGMRTAYRWDSMGWRAVPAWRGWLGEQTFSVQYPFEAAGQRWNLRLAARSTDLGGGVAPLAVLVLGCLASFALAAWVRVRSLRAGHVEALVERRTADLEQALTQTNLYLRAIEASANVVMLVDARRPGYPIEYVNPAFERMRGYSAAEAVGRRLFDVAEREPDKAAVAELLQAMRERREGHATMRLRCKSGNELYADVYVAPVWEGEDTPGHFVITQYDVSTADLEQALTQTNLYLRAIEASANVVMLVDARRPGYPIEYVNPAFERMRGYSAAEAVGRRLFDVAEREPDKAAVAELLQAMRERREGHATMRLRCKSGNELYADVYVAPVWEGEDTPGHFVITQYDVSTAKRYEAELEVRARYDTLTGLANRALLQDRIEAAIALAGPNDAVWVAALDLDHFKYVNDTLGHGAGDEMLKAVASRILATVGRADTVARTGGDEFVLVLPGRADESEAAATVQAVLLALAAPLSLHGQELVMTGSAGLAAWPADGLDGPTLIQHAEVAMYRAKDLGRNAVQFYTPAMNARARERMALEGALRSAPTRASLV